MPKMDGLEATRAIRHVETLRRSSAKSDLYWPASSTSSGSPATRSSSLGSSFELLPVPPQQPAHHAKIFALTGLATVDDKRKAFTSGVDGYLVKPVSLGTLEVLFKKIGF